MHYSTVYALGMSKVGRLAMWVAFRGVSGNSSRCAVPLLESEPGSTDSSFMAGISELRWAPASKVGSIHVVISEKAPGQTGKTVLCVAVGQCGPHAAR